MRSRVFGGLSVVMLLTAAGITGRAESPDRSVLVRADGVPVVQVPLTFAPDLPVPARIALIEEATQIWRDAGVAIDWRPGGGPCEPGRCVRGLITHHPLEGRQEARTVGQLIRGEGGAAALLVSIDEAERIVREAPAPKPRPALLEGDPVGTVLGRAVAHELGHYLLDTATHASHGLMRARFEPSEFTDLRSTAFALDAEAASWVRNRMSRGLPVGPSVLTMPAVVRARSNGGPERLTFSYHR